MLLLPPFWLLFLWVCVFLLFSTNLNFKSKWWTRIYWRVIEKFSWISWQLPNWLTAHYVLFPLALSVYFVCTICRCLMFTFRSISACSLNASLNVCSSFAILNRFCFKCSINNFVVSRQVFLFLSKQNNTSMKSYLTFISYTIYPLYKIWFVRHIYILDSYQIANPCILQFFRVYVCFIIFDFKNTGDRNRILPLFTLNSFTFWSKFQVRLSVYIMTE